MLEIKDWRNVFYLKEAWKHPEVWWTKFPVARASTSYRRLMATRDGHTAFAVFIGLLRIVQRGKTMGVLSLKGKAIEAIDVAAETGIPLKMCEAGMALLKSDAIGWLVEKKTQGQQGTQSTEAEEDDAEHAGAQPADDRRNDGEQPADDRRPAVVTPPKRREEKRREDNSSSSTLELGASGAGGPVVIAAAAAGVLRREVILSPDVIEKRAVAIATRPSWLHDETKAWISAETARTLAALPFTNQAFADVMRAAKASRRNLRNPAGYVIKKLQEAGRGGGAKCG